MRPAEPADSEHPVGPDVDDKSRLHAAARRRGVRARDVYSLPRSDQGIDLKFEALADALTVPDHGFSVRLDNGISVTGGYAVAVHPECERIFVGPVTAEDLCYYVSDHADTLALPGRVFGGWRDPASGAAFLDISVITRDLCDALRLARRCDQRAVFDFAALTSTPVASQPFVV